MDQETTETDEAKASKTGIFGKLFGKTEGSDDQDDQEQSEGQSVSSLVTEHKIIKGSFIVQGNSIVIILFAQDGRQIQRTIKSDKSYVSFALT